MTEIKRAKRISKKQVRSELFQRLQQIKHGIDGLGILFEEMTDANIALQQENEQLRTALQNSKLERANIPRRESARTFQGKSIE